jgi:predicted transglutaminase-like cysteine proteinase
MKAVSLLLILLPLSCPAYDMAPQLIGWKFATQLLDHYPVRLHSLPITNFEAKLEEFNREINAQPYSYSAITYRDPDVWETPVQFYSSGGQCRDYAIAKYHQLYSIGVADADMLFAAVLIRSGEYKGQFHAVLIVHYQGRTYILDNRDDRIRNTMAEYEPVYFINRIGWRAVK